MEYDTPEAVSSPLQCLDSPSPSPGRCAHDDHERLAAVLKALGDLLQAVQAVASLNGTELAWRKILVREDREDRDVKQYNKENGIETPERESRPPRRERRPPQQQQNGPREERAPRPERRAAASSGLQVPTLRPALQISIYIVLDTVKRATQKHWRF